VLLPVSHHGRSSACDEFARALAVSSGALKKPCILPNSTDAAKTRGAVHDMIAALFEIVKPASNAVRDVTRLVGSCANRI
jgi:hypothetical protein